MDLQLSALDWPQFAQKSKKTLTVLKMFFSSHPLLSAVKVDLQIVQSVMQHYLFCKRFSSKIGWVFTLSPALLLLALRED